MPDVDNLARLVDRLVKLSNQGKVDWEETAEDNEFQAAFPNYSVILRNEWVRESWGRDIYEVRMLIRNKQGHLLDSATPADFRESYQGVLTPAEDLTKLYDAARRRALRVDDALKDLLSDLDDL